MLIRSAGSVRNIAAIVFLAERKGIGIWLRTVDNLRDQNRIFGVRNQNQIADKYSLELEISSHSSAGNAKRPRA